MSTNEDLARLFAELKTAGSPLRRMKILSRAWRTLRRLSPKARKDLAAQVGIDGADEVLEQLAGKNRKLTPAALLGSLEALRSADPKDLQQTLSDLRRPAGRRALLDRGIEALSRKLDDPEEGAPLSPPTPTVLDAVPVDEPRATQRPVAVAATPATAAAAAAVTAGAATAAKKKRRRTPQAPGPTGPPAAKQNKRTTPAKQHAATRATQRKAESAKDARPQPVLWSRPTPPRATRQPASRPTPATPVAPPTASKTPAPPRTDLVDTLARTERLSAKFRALNDRIDEARGLPVEELRRLLAAFPSDWSRRRALARLLERRIPRDLHRAMFLVETLESRTAQRWCVARILHGWPLSDHERSALLERRGGFIRQAS